MKRIIASILCIAVLSCSVIGCGKDTPSEHNTIETTTVAESVKDKETPGFEITPEYTAEAIPSDFPEFSGLDDEKLFSYIQDKVYTELEQVLSNQDYIIEGIDIKYISKEYLEEKEYNSKDNIFFGYTLSDLDEQFGDTKYVFSLSETGKTMVTPLVEIPDDTYDKVVKNVAIGSGVILVCVTVSVLTAGAAPAVSLIFAASAKTATSFALSSGIISGVSGALITGYQTGDFEEAMKAAALKGSEGFKWGAISGAVTGGGMEAYTLKAATANGLTMNEVAIIQRESNYPIDVIKQFHNLDEFKVYKEAGLIPKMVDGKIALVQEVDLDYVSELAGKQVTNLERMRSGYAPIDPVTKQSLQLHHIGQKADGTLAVLNTTQHQGNAGILNIAGKESEIDREAFDAVREAFWKAYAASI